MSIQIENNQSTMVTRPDPPRTWGQILTFVGPGAVLAALALGGGELVMNPRAGALYGFGLAWVVVLGLFCKFWITQEIGRYTSITGHTVFDAWERTGKFYPIVFDFLAMIARGVSIAGNGLTLGTILFWAFPGWLSHVKWAILMAIVSGVILYIGLYKGKGFSGGNRYFFNSCCGLRCRHPQWQKFWRPPARHS